MKKFKSDIKSFIVVVLEGDAMSFHYKPFVLRPKNRKADSTIVLTEDLPDLCARRHFLIL